MVIDVPPSNEVHTSPSPWITIIGDALSDNSYIFNKISVLNDGQYCSSRDFNVVVKRSRKDEVLERLFLWRQFNSRGSDWPIWWVLIEIAVSMVYLLWFTISQKPRNFSYIVISWIFAILCFCFITIPTMQLMGPSIGNAFHGIANCQGAIIFSAKLAKVYYSVPLIMLAGLSTELAALVMMVRRVVAVARNSTGSSKVAVG